ncbi:tetratricopeptide repeat protein [Streptomyces sp. NPDC055005]
MSQTLKGDRLPSWRTLETVVSALGGNVEEFRGLWIQARDNQDNPAQTSPPQGVRARSLPRYLQPDGELLADVATAINHSRMLARSKDKAAAIAFLEGWKGGVHSSSAILREIASMSPYGTLEGGKYDSLFDRVVKEDPETVDSALWVAWECHRRGWSDREFDFLRSAAFMAPADPRTLNRLAYYYFTAGDVEKAEPLFLRAHSIDPSESSYLSTIVDTLSIQGKWAEAERVCDESYTANPHDDIVDAWVKALRNQGKLREAIAVLRNYADTSSADTDFTRMEIADLLSTLGDFDEAKEIYRELLGDGSGYVKARAAAALCFIHLSEGEDQAAGVMIEKVIGRPPGGERSSGDS